MHYKISLFVLILSSLIISSRGHASQEQPLTNKSESPKLLPVEYFTNRSENRSVIISPDGEHLVAIVNSKGKEVFAVVDVAQNKIVSVIGVRGSGGNIGDVYWVSTDRIVYSIYESTRYDKRQKSTGELYGVNVDGSRHNIIFGYRAGEKTTGTRLKRKKSSYASHEIIDILEDDKNNILIAYYPWKIYGNAWHYNDMATPLIQMLNVYNGKLKKIDYLPISGSTPIVDNNGNVRFAVGKNEENETQISYKNNKDSEWENFSLADFEGTNVRPLSFAEDNQSVYLSANVDFGTRAIYLFNLETQSIQKIFHDPNIDMNQIVYDFPQRRVVYVATELAKPEYHYLEPDNKKSKYHKILMSAFAGQDVVITSASKDGRKLVAYTYSDTSPGDYYLFDTKEMNANFIMGRNSWVNPDLLIATESVEFTTRDQQTIYGYLTRPKQEYIDGLPLIVLPHGGPHGVRDEWGYDWRVQLFAHHGYAVLQVNFRGSGGFGDAFEKIGYGKWGTLMQDDITDATRALIEQQIVDPNRICIYGASYGGYAALMGAVREPDLYQCAIGSAGVYDLPLMFEEGNIVNHLKYGLAYLEDAVGNDIDDLKKRSPAYNADKIKANILLIHGGQDKQVPISQADSLKQAFEQINKPYQWMELRNEGHGYIDNENRQKVYQKILSFLAENIAPNQTQPIAEQ